VAVFFQIKNKKIIKKN